MLKTAVDRGEELLSNPPSRDAEMLSEYVDNLRTAKRDLTAELNDPRTRMGNRNVVKTASVLSEVEENLLTAEAILEAVRNEVAPDEMVETDSLGTLNVQASVEKLAVATAAQTIGLNNFDRLARGLQAYDESIEPQIDPQLRDFPRERYTERLEQLIAMPESKLAAEVQKAFPTKEWIGPEPEPVGGEGDLGHIPSHFEKDQTTQPEKQDIDGTFEDAIEKERKFRGIDKADTAGKALEKASKQADANNSTPGSHEPSSTGDGAQLQGTPPEPDKAFEDVIEEEANKSHGAPVGPNRRRSQDVPAYSTEKSKLTSSLIKSVQSALKDEGLNVNYETSHKLTELYLKD